MALTRLAPALTTNRSHISNQPSHPNLPKKKVDLLAYHRGVTFCSDGSPLECHGFSASQANGQTPVARLKPLGDQGTLTMTKEPDRTGFDTQSVSPKAIPPSRCVGQRHTQATGAMTKDMKSELVALLPRLRRYARSLCKSTPQADDLVQEACLRALARADQWDPAQPLDRWVFRIARNLWISDLRKVKVRLGQGHVPAEETVELSTQETGEAHVAHSDLHRQIQELPNELSEVLLLVGAEGYSYKEASEQLSIPIGTVMSRIHRARKTLSSTLSEGV